ncbi:hypothetical protein [Winogradskyella sp. KYW1333]|uniref:hypothetical protein n=1 Tax=Winogradskyella sp. KYW1333 TaxID=2282123 RepID=UPI000DF2C041|nr:hypothetical protein [Winogradskyella sp. KYW1333]RCT54205.1 hypothetical protein DUZ96_08255 [Winogradskyella sp. KYW1333]
MTSTTQKPPVWFWIISVLALVWNAMGIMAYLGRAFATDEMIAALPEEQQAEFLVEYPAWYTAAFALAVFGGALGALFLLIRKKWAISMFVLSALSAIVQHVYLFINVEGMSLTMPIMVMVICVVLVWFARHSSSKNWIS